MAVRGKTKGCRIIMFVFLFFIAVASAIVYVRVKQCEAERYQELYSEARVYLDDKFTECMVIEDGYSYYDNIYTLWAYPEDKEEVRFRVEFYVNEEERRDTYLIARRESEIVDKIKISLDNQDICYEDVSAYLTLSGRFSGDFDDLESIDYFDSVLLRISNIDYFDSNEEVINLTIRSISELDFVIKGVTVSLYKGTGEEEIVKEEFEFRKHVLIEGNYIKLD